MGGSGESAGPVQRKYRRCPKRDERDRLLRREESINKGKTMRQTERDAKRGYILHCSRGKDGERYIAVKLDTTREKEGQRNKTNGLKTAAVLLLCAQGTTFVCFTQKRQRARNPGFSGAR